MIDVDKVYKTVMTILNKEQDGYITPEEFNLMASNVQLEVFRGYFADENRDKNRQNKGNTNRGYSNLPFNERQRIDQFAEEQVLSKSGNFYSLPNDIYFMEDDGLYILNDQETPTVIEETERKTVSYLLSSEAPPTEVYPIYERYSDRIKVYPQSITEEIHLRYLRNPKAPKWTSFLLPNGDPVYNPAAIDKQDFELHESEFSNIVLRILSYCGLNLREQEVIQVSETLKEKDNIKENN